MDVRIGLCGYRVDVGFNQLYDDDHSDARARHVDVSNADDDLGNAYHGDSSSICTAGFDRITVNADFGSNS